VSGDYVIGAPNARGEHEVLTPRGERVGLGRFVLPGSGYLGLQRDDAYTPEFVVTMSRLDPGPDEEN
jgi:hypothetical protein